MTSQTRPHVNGIHRSANGRTATNGESFREVFHIDRALEFFTEEELTKQIGHDVDDWPSALLLELIGNGLDATEQHRPPQIHVEVGDDSFSVRDNGPGIPWDTVKASLDYRTRTSDKSYFVSPTRGRQGNALKTVWAAPYVVSGGKRGLVAVESRGQKRVVQVTADQITQKPRVFLTDPIPSVIKIGSKITVHWGQEARSLESRKSIDSYGNSEYRIENEIKSADLMVKTFALFNPHAAFAHEKLKIPPRQPGWQKWTAADEPPATWYTPEKFKALMVACLEADRDQGRAVRSVRAFLLQFRGLKGCTKQKSVCEAASVDAGETIEDVVADQDRMESLLDAMKAETKEVKPARLGIIGQENLRNGMVAAFGCKNGTIRYRKAVGTDDDGVPWVVEAAFGCRNHEAAAIVAVGVNWSPTLRVPFDSLTDVLQSMRIEFNDPVVLAIHVAYPAACAQDRGKTRYVLP